jgi:hydroxymethylpyrimidine pyrophosphatase-like HAD family hydrolase
MVTGRELPDLKAIFPHLDLFERVVAENGGLLYIPATQEETPLAASPPQALVKRLQAENLPHLSFGRAIIATREPYEQAILEAVRDLGLEYQIIFNKGSVMALSSGVNKATGLGVALDELGISLHNVAGVGDAENDHAFLLACGLSAAVANALPAVKGTADIVLENPRGAGVVELMARIDKEDAALMPPARHGILVGHARDRDILIPSNGRSVLISGRSGIGKSTLATALTECMCEKKFQFCVFDPEGDYQELEHAICVGDAKTPPTPDAIFALLENARDNVVINTLALEMAERPTFFAQLLPRILSLRARLSRPHWLIIDEAHHLLPADRSDVTVALPEFFNATIFITVHADAVAPAVLRSVDTVIALGDHASEVISSFCKATGIDSPELPAEPGEDEVLFWRRAEPPFAVKVRGPKQTHKRHTRKYAEGALLDEENFHFRGPNSALNLRAQNTTVFVQMAEGVDDETWDYHLRRGEYSDWFRRVIKDPELADEVAEVEGNETLSPKESRKRIADAVNRRYTAPAKAAAAVG